MDIHFKILVGCVFVCLGVGIWTAKINADQQREIVDLRIELKASTIKALTADVSHQRDRIDSLCTEVTGLRKCVANQATISALQTSLITK
jgi:hypothetical protein